MISKVNQAAKTAETDSLFRYTFREAKRINDSTNGAFDITVAPIINALGFVPEKQMEVDSALIDSLCCNL